MCVQEINNWMISLMRRKLRFLLYVVAYETSSKTGNFYWTMRCLWMFVTAVCFLFLLKLKWTKNKNIYDVFTQFTLSAQSFVGICSR